MLARKIGLGVLVAIAIAFGLVRYAIRFDLAPAIAAAYYPSAMFDTDKVVTLNGVVREFEATSWRSSISLVTFNPETKDVLDYDYRVEMGPPQPATDDGWAQDSFRPGTKLTITVHPRKDGSPSGMYRSLVLPTGDK